MSAPKVNNVSIAAYVDLMQCLGNYVRLFQKYMNTLDSSIFIHLLLVASFPIHIYLGPGFISHKYTVVTCVNVSMFYASSPLKGLSIAYSIPESLCRYVSI